MYYVFYYVLYSSMVTVSAYNSSIVTYFLPVPLFLILLLKSYR
jgi:hypothetical protein